MAKMAPNKTSPQLPIAAEKLGIPAGATGELFSPVAKGGTILFSNELAPLVIESHVPMDCIGAPAVEFEGVETAGVI